MDPYLREYQLAKTRENIEKAIALLELEKAGNLIRYKPHMARLKNKLIDRKILEIKKMLFGLHEV